MTDDIVTRLRGWPCMGLGDPTACHLCDAADEIERLTEWRKNALLALDKREAEIERLRAERDMLADALTAQVSPDLSAKTARLLFRNAIAELERRHG